MCGICGVIQVSGEPRRVIEPAMLARMTDAMTHRGPDDRGAFEAPGVAFGVRRLSVIDVVDGHQPFANEAGDIWAMQNGEIYNHDQIRSDLVVRGHAMRSRCDTEVIPHLYERLGPGFPEALRGIFGVALWDGAHRRAVLVRDRIGVKPLYWSQRGDLVVFASELKSLLASGLVDPELDYDALDAYLTLGFIPARRTPLAQVSKLSPGHRLIVEEGRVRIEPYWVYPAPVVAAPQPSESEYADGLLASLEESVQMRLMSDVPLGAMLSGGLDSSLIVALMARNMSEPVKTFSVGFSDDRDSNELEDARYVARTFGTDHHELELPLAADVEDLERLVWTLDEPIADLSALGFEALSQLATQHVTVALSGQGADELLGGYRKHQAAAMVGRLGALPTPLRTAAVGLAAKGSPRIHRAAQALAAPDQAHRLIEMSGRLGGGRRQELYRGPLRGRVGTAALDAIVELAAPEPVHPLSATLHIDAQLALVDTMLHYFDRTSMAHSLEVRVPFLDHHTVEYCARVPSGLKVRRLQTKYLLKRAATGIVPDRIIHKQKLGFFRGSTASWLETQLRSAGSELLLASDSRCAEFLDSRAIARLAQPERLRRDASDAHLLNSILILEIWLRTYRSRALDLAGSEAVPAG